MTSSIIKFSAILLLVILSYYGTYGLLVGFETLQNSKDADDFRDLISAFLGALFAFFFVVIGSFFQRIHENSNQHRNALVKVEYDMTLAMTINSDNTFALTSLIESIDQGVLNFLSYGEIPINRELLAQLKNIDIVNDLNDLYIDIFKEQQNLENVVRFYEGLRERLIDGKINQATFLSNVRGQFQKDLKDLKKRLDVLDKKIEIISSKSAILIKCDESVITWLISIFAVKKNYSKGFDKLVEKRLLALRKERQGRLKESLEEFEYFSKQP